MAINVGKQIRKVLNQRQEMNQEKLAKLSGVSKSRLSRIINQKSPPSMAELEKIANALRVKTKFLVSDSDEEPSFKLPQKDKELFKLLKDYPDLEISLRALSKLSDKEKKSVSEVIQRFAEVASAR